MNPQYLEKSLLEPEKVVEYTKWVAVTNETEDSEEYDETEECSQEKMLKRIGMLSQEKGKYHKYCGFNKFTKETFLIPSQEDGWKTKEQSIREQFLEDRGLESVESTEEEREYIERHLNRFLIWVKKSVCNPEATIFTPKEPLTQRHHDLQLYKTSDNGGIGFMVFIDELNNTVYVYGETNDVVTKWYDDETVTFDTLIKVYNPLQIFIGKSYLNEMTEFSGGYGDKFDGNSILLKIPSNTKHRYAYIGWEVFEFTTDEPITKYVSSVGNNDVPYPYAESQNWCYDMLGTAKTPVTSHPNREKIGHVFENDEAEYLEMSDVTKIAERGDDNCKHEASPNEDTMMVRFNEPCEFTMLKHTCK